MAKRTTAPVNHVVVVSDLHVGCSLGLMHPSGGRTDNNQVVKPSVASTSCLSLVG